MMLLQGSASIENPRMSHQRLPLLYLKIHKDHFFICTSILAMYVSRAVHVSQAATENTNLKGQAMELLKQR